MLSDIFSEGDLCIVAFAIIGYPPDKAAEVALDTVREFLEKHHSEVRYYLPKNITTLNLMDINVHVAITTIGQCWM